MKGPEIKNGTVTVKLICNNLTCGRKDCSYHHTTLDNYSTEHKVLAHLDGNPLYCVKGDWNGYQINGVMDTTKDIFGDKKRRNK